MRGVNRVMLIGNLGKDPDVQFLEGNIGVAKFPLATTETYKDRNGKLVSQTEWHTIVLWRGLADLAQKYLHKGSLIYIEGRLRTRSWEDKEGNKKFATEVVGDNLIMLDKRGDGHTQDIEYADDILTGWMTKNQLTRSYKYAGKDLKTIRLLYGKMD